MLAKRVRPEEEAERRRSEQEKDIDGFNQVLT
jgi:hypothetical protein